MLHLIRVLHLSSMSNFDHLSHHGALAGAGSQYSQCKRCILITVDWSRREESHFTSQFTQPRTASFGCTQYPGRVPAQLHYWLSSPGNGCGGCLLLHAFQRIQSNGIGYQNVSDALIIAILWDYIFASVSSLSGSVPLVVAVRDKTRTLRMNEWRPDWLITLVLIIIALTLF